MAWIKSKCGGQTIYTDSDTHKTWYKGKSGGATIWSSGDETITKTTSGGATVWSSNKHGSKSFHTWMDEDDD